jgi:hypothetical protein
MLDAPATPTMAAGVWTIPVVDATAIADAGATAMSDAGATAMSDAGATAISARVGRTRSKTSMQDFGVVRTVSSGAGCHPNVTYFAGKVGFCVNPDFSSKKTPRASGDINATKSCIYLVNCGLREEEFG